MSSICRAFLLMLFVGLSSQASAFGLRTHLMIADELIRDVSDDCRVTLKGAQFYVSPEICSSIRAYPQSFRAGVIGPDGFPDFITGQVTTHPGIVGDWQTADWIDRLLDRAQPGPELAFAAGYAVHAASDVFAHSYVNNYSGDIFDLKDERNVERRHFVLEKYIDYRLPVAPDPGALAAPQRFLSQQLIFDVDAARLSGKSGTAPHIASMYHMRVAVRDLDDSLRKIEDNSIGLIAKILAQQVELGTKITSGETTLEAAVILLGANEERLKASKAILDIQEQAFNSAVDAIERNKSNIASSELRLRAALETIKMSEAAIKEAIEFKARAQNDLVELRRRLALTPSTVSKQVCGEVGGACSSCGWLCSPICEPAKLVCKAVDVANDVYTNLVNSVSNLERQLANAETAIQQKTADIAAAKTSELAEIQYALEQQGLTVGLEAARDAARVPFEAARKQYEIELAATTTVDQNVKKLKAEVKKLREKLVDTQNVEEALREVFNRVRPLSAYASNWLSGIDRAGDAYIGAAQESAIAMTAGSGGVLAPYSDWLACHGSVFLGMPWQIPHAVCKGEEFISHVQSEVDKIVETVLPEPFASVYRQVTDIKALIKNDVRNAASDTAITLAKLAAPDQATADFIDLLANPSLASREKLKEVFATSSDAAGKDLLTFPDVTTLIDEDLGLRNGVVDPEAFKALAYALIMSRMALLDREGLVSVTQRFGGDPAALKLSAGGPRYSIMMDMVRSIDGNHQWQPFGLPYPRAGTPAHPPEADQRQYGYGPGQDRPGFPFYVSTELRRDVFAHLFPDPFIGKIGKLPSLNLPTYLFPTCRSNPFPTTFDAQGVPVLSDTRCADLAAKPLRPSSWATFKRRWHGFWENLLGVRHRPSWSRSSFAKRPQRSKP